MKKILIASIVAAGFIGGVASANEIEAQCNAYMEENNGDNSGCSCLGAAAAEDDALATAIAAIQSQADVDAADEHTKAALAACWPDAAQN